jgi:hypothetical protein
MALRLIIILIIGLPAFYFSNMDSPSRLFAYVLPIITFVCVVALAMWVIALFAHIGQQPNRHP